MTAAEFIAKWHNNPLKERASYQLHFLDLCELVGAEKPSPQTENTYCFERGASRTGAGHGWADVWKQGYFAFEYKANGKNLDTALKQLMTYALALDNPPLLVVCDTDIIQIHTHFTGTPSEVHTIALSDIGQHDNLNKLKALFNSPDYFRPKVSTHAVTIEAANRLGKIADRLNEAGNTPLQTAHFLIQCVFCMFAEDAKLLPEKLFETVLDKSNPDGTKAQARLTQLFNAMQTGGDFAMIDIPWFNGGLFADINVPMLTTADVVELLGAARMDWRAIEPAILGTLFERGLNPDMRSQLGAHYTDPDTINKIIYPVIVEPILHDWQRVKQHIDEHMQHWHTGGKGSKKAFEQANTLFIEFLETFKDYRVLDPACGSGNFLYLSLKALKECEHRINLEAEMLGLQRQLGVESSPANVMGIEINPYAAELARVTVWIGELQWMLDHGYALRTNPILQTLNHIVQQDALIQFNDDGTTHETQWPACTVIVGNPPFLGDKKMLSELGENYTKALRKLYKGRIAGGADLVTYWFEKARYLIEHGQCQRAGLVATNSIRGGSNRKVLSRILETKSEHGKKLQAVAIIDGANGKKDQPNTMDDIPVFDSCNNRGNSNDAGSLIRIFNAYADEPWINAGAAVRVSLVCFGQSQQPTHLNGLPVNTIFADLTAQTESTDNRVDVTTAKPLVENKGIAFQAPVLVGEFDISLEIALEWLKQPNPNGRPNSDVLKPLTNGKDINSRSRYAYVIDFSGMSEAEASLYELPFAHVLEKVKPERIKNKRKSRAEKWWLHGESSPGIRQAMKQHGRYIGTAQVSKHRFFTWLDSAVFPGQATVIAITRSDDTTFGVLESRFHKVWALALGTALEDRPRYTPSTTFDTFPFPQGMSPADTAPVDRATMRKMGFVPVLGEIGGNPEDFKLYLPFETPVTPVCEDKANFALRRTIAEAAFELNKLRNNWLNPKEWVEWERTGYELFAKFPMRTVAKAGFENELKKRTLTNLYNTMPAWLVNAHAELDKAVATAYGWTDYTPDMPDSEILARLLRLNGERSRMGETKELNHD